MPTLHFARIMPMLHFARIMPMLHFARIMPMLHDRPGLNLDFAWVHYICYWIQRHFTGRDRMSLLQQISPGR